MRRHREPVLNFGRAFLIRLPLAYLCALALVFALRGPACQLFLPIFETEVMQIIPGCDVASAKLTEGRVKVIVQIRDLPAPAPNPARLRTSLPLDLLLIAPVLGFTLVFAWPRLRRGSRFAVALWLILLLSLAQMLDQPFVTADAIMASAGLKNGVGRAACGYWSFLLDNGGRQFLAILAFGISLAVTRRLRKRRPRGRTRVRSKRASRWAPPSAAIEQSP